MIPDSLAARIAAIRADHLSGATSILLGAIDVLRDAAGQGPDVMRQVADELCRAQPGMAGLRTAAAVVTGAADPVAVLDRLGQRVRRSPRSIARHAAGVLLLDSPGARGTRRELRIATVSSSVAVEATILELKAHRDVRVACAESLPAREGRGLAQRLAAAGVTVEVFTDAGISSAVTGVDSVLVGADAVGPDAFINKVGTAAVSALAAAAGIPVYVLCGRERIVSRAVFEDLRSVEGSAAEVWPGSPPGLTVRNPYFERISLDLTAMLITDGGAGRYNMSVTY
jgi:translation initiation factor 2B subunit (eIF-2B alpha/beta/delta family)